MSPPQEQPPTRTWAAGWVTSGKNPDHPSRRSNIAALALLGLIAWDVSKGQTGEERQEIARGWVKSALIVLPLTLIGIVIFSLLVYEVLAI